MTEKIKILFLAANPLDSSRLRLDEELREIEKRILMGPERDRFELFSQWAVTPDDLQRALLRYQPHIVHFSGHGSRSRRGIVLEDISGNSQPLSRSALSDLFKILKGNIRVVILNACYGAKQAEGLAEVIDYTIGVGTAIADESAVTFATSFYQALAFGRSVNEAFGLANNLLKANGVPDSKLPRLVVRKGANVSEPFLPTLKPPASRHLNVDEDGDVNKSVSRVGDGNAVSFVLTKLLKESLQALHAFLAMKYAFGVLGLILIISVVVTLRINLLIAVFGTIIMVVLMSLLVIFVRIRQTAPKYLTIPTLILVYFSLIMTMATATLLLTSVFFNEPIRLKDSLLRDPAEAGRSETPSPRIGKPVDSSRSFSVYPDNYHPSGKMGDTGDLTIEEIPGAVRCAYETLGRGPHQWDWTYEKHQLNLQPAQFAGMAYLNPPNNWGTDARGGFDLRGYRVIRWDARSLQGEVRVEFVIGGINWQWDDLKKERSEPPYPDSLRRQSLGGIRTLTPQWQSFEFNLADANIPDVELACVVGAFSCVISWGPNGVKLNAAGTGPEHPKTLEFEVRNIRYER